MDSPLNAKARQLLQDWDVPPQDPSRAYQASDSLLHQAILKDVPTSQAHLYVPEAIRAASGIRADPAAAKRRDALLSAMAKPSAAATNANTNSGKSKPTGHQSQPIKVSNLASGQDREEENKTPSGHKAIPAKLGSTASSRNLLDSIATPPLRSQAAQDIRNLVTEDQPDGRERKAAAYQPAPIRVPRIIAYSGSPHDHMSPLDDAIRRRLKVVDFAPKLQPDQAKPKDKAKEVPPAAYVRPSLPQYPSPSASLPPTPPIGCHVAHCLPLPRLGHAPPQPTSPVRPSATLPTARGTTSTCSTMPPTATGGLSAPSPSTTTTAKPSSISTAGPRAKPQTSQRSLSSAGRPTPGCPPGSTNWKMMMMATTHQAHCT
jgi:hypothetical protein